MSMHKKPLTELEHEGLRLHHLAIGKPSQLSDAFRLGMAWAQKQSQAESERDALLAQLVDAFGDGYYDGFLDGAKHHEQTDCNTDPQYLGEDALHCSEIAESEKSARIGTPAKHKHLAEIRAEAGRAGFIAGINARRNIEYDINSGDWMAADRAADEYAAKVRQGGAA